MTLTDDNVDLTALVDGTLQGPEWDAWLAQHPAAAAEVATARRVRALVAQLRSVEVDLPADFETRILAQVRANTTLLDVFELFFVGAGRALREVLDVVFVERSRRTSLAD